MPHVTSSDGTRIFYTTAGEGEPFVLSHGVTHSWQSWENLGYVDALKDRYRLILIDTRGHGESGRPHDPDAYAMSQLAADVLAVLDDLGIEHCHLWGHSLGARAGFHLAAGHPDRVRSLIAWGDHPYGTTPMEADVVDHMIEISRNGMGGWVAMMEESGSLAQYRDPAARKEAVLTSDAEAIIAACIASANDAGIPDAIPRMLTPCLLLAGEHEDFMDMEAVHRAAAALPNADYVLVGGIAHTMCKSGLVLPYVLAFLDRVASGAFPAAAGA